MLLSVSLVGIPNWIDQGPRPIISDPNEINVIANPGNAAGGAIESLVIRPIPNSTLFQIYAATVNGGVWRTDNADPANPANITWRPLTDQQTSLAMGSVAFSPLDATGNTLYASTGSFSNNAQAGGPAVGIMRTTDGGATWSTFRLNPAGTEPQAKTVLPTSIDLDPGAGVQQMVLVGTLGGGLRRSNDNGQTYTNLSGLNGLPNGNVTQLVADPNNTNQFYAAVAQQGVFQGVFNPATGVITWTGVNNAGLTNSGTSGDIQLTAVDDGANTILFSLVVGSAPNNQGAFRSVNGGNWTALAQPPAIFANPNDGSFFPGPSQSGFFITGDPTNSNVAYITGYSSGDHVFRYDPSGAGSWVPIMGGGGAGTTRPHPDGRALAFLNNTTLVEVDDGGIYFLPNPAAANATTNNWQSFNGNTTNGTGIGAAEIHNLAWDSLFNVVVGGSQDNGTEVQTATGNVIWTVFNGGDGGDVAIDNATLAGASRSIRYVSSQNMAGLRRVVFDSASNIVQNVTILPAAGLTNFTGTFIPHFEVNAAAPAANQSKSLVVGGGGTSPVYEATMPDAVNSNADVTWTAVAVPAGFGTVNTLALGGRRNGADDANILYAGTQNGLFLRTTVGGSLAATTTAFPGGGVRDIALDPEDWMHIFVISASGIWESTDAGANWTNRTGNLPNPATANLQTVEYADAGAVDAVLVGAQGGVFRMITNNPGVWSEYGQFLPNTATFDLDYNAADDVLVAAAYGRGAWEVQDASDTLTSPGVLQIFGDDSFFGQDDTIRLVIDAANNSLLDVFFNGVLSQFQLSTIQQIDVFGFGGKDTLTVDSTNGLLSILNGIRFDGGGGFDALRLDQTAGPTRTSDVYSIGQATGSGSSVISHLGLTQTVFFENLEPTIDVVPALSLTVNATPESNAIDYTVGSLVTNRKVTIDNYESIEFANKPQLLINALAGDDTISVLAPIAGVDLSVIVNGGAAAGSDKLVVETPGTTSAEYSPDAGTLALAGGGNSSLLTLFGIEQLVYDGQGDDSTLKVNGTAGDDTLVHKPGAANDAGTVAVNSLLPISYQNLGAAGALTIDGAGGANDTLVGQGTLVNDSFTINATSISLNARIPILPQNVENLTLQGLAGDDIFTLVPAVQASPFARIDLQGGGQASPGGDQANLVGTAGADNFSLDGPNVTAGGRVVNTTGVENINFNIGGGSDGVRYTGVSGTADKITIAASDTPGVGQIIVPGVITYSFRRLERVSARANAGDADTLTFAGTANPDTFRINAAAAGTTTPTFDPVLQISNATVGTMLTLLNYTGFATLNVLGLDGADVFNVFTSSVRGRNLFLDGGLPTAKQMSTDKLNVFYTAPRPRIIHSTATQDPRTGLVDLNYGTSRTLVQYADMENVVIARV